MPIFQATTMTFTKTKAVFSSAVQPELFYKKKFNTANNSNPNKVVSLTHCLEIDSINSIEGVIYGIISAISLALIITIGEKFSNSLGGLNVAFAQLVFAAIILFYFTLDGVPWLFKIPFVGMFLGFFLTGVGLSTYWYVVKIIKPISVSTISYLEPLTGVVLGIYLLGESINIRQFIGFVLVIVMGILQLIYDTKLKSTRQQKLIP